jgi:hypothetical protein
MGLFSKKPRETYVVDWDGSYTYEVVGESHHRSELLWLIQRAPEGQRANGEVWTLAILEREPGNKYDRNAVRVMIDGKQVGYISKGHARAVGDFISRAEAHGAVGTRAVIGWSTYGGDNAPIGVRLDLFDPKRDNADVTLRTLDEIGPVNVRAPRAETTKQGNRAATPKTAAKPKAPPTNPQRKTFGPLLARASVENLTRTQYLRIAELADAFESACGDLASKAEASIEDARALFTSFGIMEMAGFAGLDISKELQDVSNCSGDVSLTCNDLDEWDDSDKDDRDDLRESVRDAADTLLIELSTPLPVAAAPVPDSALVPVATLVTAPPPRLPPAAWYPNPQGPGQRYWDGAQWTEHYAP